MNIQERLRWYEHRLKAMGWAEVCHRAADVWSHVTEEDFLQRIGQDAEILMRLRTDVPSLPDPATAPAALRSQLHEDAGRLVRGQWQLFGWREAEVGAPPCWHRDAACGVVIDPDVSAHRLNHRELRDGADARTIWEINRWAEMTRLAMHGWLNEDPEAMRTAQLWLEDWCDRNPPGIGINWTSPLEAALRLMNFCWFDALIRAAPASRNLIKAQDALAVRIVPLHAGWIWRYRSSGSSANNHLLGELAALTLAARRWPGLAFVSCTAEEAWRKLETEVLKQFADDGGSREQALHYHLFAFEMAWQAARAMGCREGPAWERLALAGRFFCAMIHPAAPWDFGDCDDAQAVPCTLRRSAAAGEWKAWFQGESGAVQFWLGESPLPLTATADSAEALHWLVFRASGMAVCDAWPWKLRVDASPLGFGKLAAHGHHDALHVSIWDGDEALIIDPGTGGYYAAKELREELAGWGAHNGPQAAAGFRLPERVGPFLQVNHHGVPQLTADGATAMAIFQHEDHAFQRRILVRDDEIEINDAEAQNKSFHVTWHVAPACTVRATEGADLNCLTITSGSRQWEMTIRGQVRTELGEARVSSAYGRIDMAMMIAVSAESAVCTRIKRVR